MSDLTKCDRCGKIRRKNSKEIWTSGSIHASTIMIDEREDRKYIGSFDLCAKCAKPFLNYSIKFFKKSK